MQSVQVRRSAVRMWLISLAGIPLIVIAVDVLFQRRFSNMLRELVFPPNDPQLFEARDVIWAWVMLVAGLGLTGFALKELLAPRSVLRADHAGLGLRLAGPFRAATVIPWDRVADVRSDQVEDEGDVLPVLVITLDSRAGIPSEPWGARWLDAHTLLVAAGDWEQPASEVADQVVAYAVELAKAGRME